MAGLAVAVAALHWRTWQLCYPACFSCANSPCLRCGAMLQLEEGEPDFLGPPLPDEVAQAIAAGGCCWLRVLLRCRMPLLL